jgi:hypothetical protein
MKSDNEKANALIAEFEQKFDEIRKEESNSKYKYQ